MKTNTSNNIINAIENAANAAPMPKYATIVVEVAGEEIFTSGYEHITYDDITHIINEMKYANVDEAKVMNTTINGREWWIDAV